MLISVTWDSGFARPSGVTTTAAREPVVADHALGLVEDRLRHDDPTVLVRPGHDPVDDAVVTWGRGDMRVGRGEVAFPVGDANVDGAVDDLGLGTRGLHGGSFGHRASCTQMTAGLAPCTSDAARCVRCRPEPERGSG